MDPVVVIVVHCSRDIQYVYFLDIDVDVDLNITWTKPVGYSMLLLCYMSMFIYGCCSSIDTSVVAIKELHIVVVWQVRLHGDP
jgi:hypothetical protein